MISRDANCKLCAYGQSMCATRGQRQGKFELSMTKSGGFQGENRHKTKKIRKNGVLIYIKTLIFLEIYAKISKAAVLNTVFCHAYFEM